MNAISLFEEKKEIDCINLAKELLNILKYTTKDFHLTQKYQT